LFPCRRRLQQLHKGIVPEGSQRLAAIDKLSFGLPLEGGGEDLADKGLRCSLVDDGGSVFLVNPQGLRDTPSIELDFGANASRVQLKSERQ
jgi:hypothetical protein